MIARSEDVPMEVMDQPGWLIDASSEPPSSRAALFGWYQPAWCPFIRLELHHVDGQHRAAWYCLEDHGGTDWWRATLQQTLVLEQGASGFSVVDDPYDDRRTLRYAYSETWGRFELQIRTGDPPHITRMPLARIPPPLPGQARVSFGDGLGMKSGLGVQEACWTRR